MQIASEPKIPIGMSRWGFLDSSAAVATMSKPMKAKNTSAAALKMPPIPNVPVLMPMSCSSVVVASPPPGAGFEPLGGMNGSRLPPET